MRLVRPAALAVALLATFSLLSFTSLRAGLHLAMATPCSQLVHAGGGYTSVLQSGCGYAMQSVILLSSFGFTMLRLERVTVSLKAFAWSYRIFD